MELVHEDINVLSILGTMYENNSTYQEISKIPNLDPHQILKIILKFKPSPNRIVQASHFAQSFTLSSYEQISIYNLRSDPSLSTIIAQTSIMSLNSPSPPGIISKKHPSIDFHIDFTLRTSEPHYHTSINLKNSRECLIHLLDSKQACIVDISDHEKTITVYHDIVLAFHYNSLFYMISQSGHILCIQEGKVSISLPVGYISKSFLSFVASNFPGFNPRPSFETELPKISHHIESTALNQQSKISNLPLSHQLVIEKIDKFPEFQKWSNVCTLQDDLMKGVFDCFQDSLEMRSWFVRQLFRFHAVTKETLCLSFVCILVQLPNDVLKSIAQFLEFLRFGQDINLCHRHGVMEFLPEICRFLVTRDIDIFACKITLDFIEEFAEILKRAPSFKVALKVEVEEDFKVISSFKGAYYKIFFKASTAKFSLGILKTFTEFINLFHSGDYFTLTDSDLGECHLLQLLQLPSDSTPITYGERSDFSTSIPLDEEKVNTIGADASDAVFTAQLLDIRRRRLIELTQYASTYLMTSAPNPLNITKARSFTGTTRGNAEIELSEHALGGDYNRMVWPAFYLGFHIASAPDFTYSKLQKLIQEFLEELRKPVKRLNALQRARMDHIRKLKGTTFEEQFAPLPVSYIGGLISGLITNHNARLNNSQIESFFKKLPIYDLPHQSHWNELFSQMVTLSINVTRAAIIFNYSVTKGILIDYKSSDPFFNATAIAARICSADYTSSSIDEIYTAFVAHCKSILPMDPFLMECQLYLEALYVGIGIAVTNNNSLRESLLTIIQEQPKPELTRVVHGALAKNTLWCKFTPKSNGLSAFFSTPIQIHTSIRLSIVCAYIGKAKESSILFPSKFEYNPSFSLFDFFLQGCAAVLCTNTPFSESVIQFNTRIPSMALYWKLGALFAWSLKHASLGHDVIKGILKANIDTLNRLFTQTFVNTATQATINLLGSTASYDINSLSFAFAHLSLSYSLLYSGTREADHNAVLQKARKIIRSDIVSYEDIVENVATTSTQATVTYTDYNTNPYRVAAFGRPYAIVIGKAHTLLNLDYGKSCISIAKQQDLLTMMLYLLPLDQFSHESKFIQFVHSYIPTSCKKSKLMSTNCKDSILYIKNELGETVSTRTLPLILPASLPCGFTMTVRASGGDSIELTSPQENIELKRIREVNAWCEKPTKQEYVGPHPEICLFLRNPCFVAGTDINYHGLIDDCEEDVPESLLDI